MTTNLRVTLTNPTPITETQGLAIVSSVDEAIGFIPAWNTALVEADNLLVTYTFGTLALGDAIALFERAAKENNVALKLDIIHEGIQDTFYCGTNAAEAMITNLQASKPQII